MLVGFEQESVENLLDRSTAPSMVNLRFRNARIQGGDRDSSKSHPEKRLVCSSCPWLPPWERLRLPWLHLPKPRSFTSTMSKTTAETPFPTINWRRRSRL